jgi:hypothetical protein
MALHPRLASHLRSGQVSRIVYGSIIGLALVLTMEAHPPEGKETVIGSLVATAVAVALAEFYSELIGARARSGVDGSDVSTGEMVEVSLSVAFGIAFPSVFFVVAAVGWIEYDTAFGLAKWTGLGLIAGYGYAAARLNGRSHPGSLVHALGVGLIAGLLIALKALVH